MRLCVKKARLLNVKLGGRAVLPSFALIKDMAEPGKHQITFDTSGLPPQDGWRTSPPKQPSPFALHLMESMANHPMLCNLR